MKWTHCSEEHGAEIVGLTEHPASRDTPHGHRSRADDRVALSACFGLAADYVGSIFESELAVMIVTPATPRWAEGDRTMRCLVIDGRDGTREGSVRSSVSPAGQPEDEGPLHDLAVGDCFDVRVTSPEYPYARLVDCSTPHQLESYAVVTLPGEVVQVGGDQWAATDQCRERFESFVRVDPAASALRVVPLPPRVNAQGEFFVRCTVAAIDGSELVGSMEGSKR
jgi:hypothetical protein